MQSTDAASESPERASCPVCSRDVLFTDINTHIDQCLRVNDRQFGGPSASAAASATPSSSTPARHVMSRGKQSVLSGFRKRDIMTGAMSSGHEKRRRLSSTAPSPADSGTSSTRPINTRPLHHSISTTTAHPVKSGHQPLLTTPLSDVMRPATLSDYVGQQEVVGENCLLHSAIASGHIPSLIFWGPPGCGKTTLACMLAQAAREKVGARCVQLSASSCGVAGVKEAVKVARNDRVMFKRQTVLFIDEIHQFNKLQQDTFLPHVEDGTITLLGATTENPSFKLNSALLSRCKVIVLKKLQPQDVQTILRNAIRRLLADEDQQEVEEKESVVIDDDVITLLSELCDGDARIALNALQQAVETAKTRYQMVDAATTRQLAVDGHQQVLVTVTDAKESLQCSHLLYDRAGDEHYNCISALHKSMRGSHASASLYWLARMLCAGEDPLYVARRIVRFASEDIGLADPVAVQLAVSTYQACQVIGMPECDVILAQAVVYMARAPKSVEVYRAYGRAVACVKECRGPQPSVPLHLCNAPTSLMKDLGYGKGYQYNPDFVEPVNQRYLPDELENTDFF